MQDQLAQLLEDLSQARHQQKLTQAELANKTGINQAHISRIEQGKKNITIYSLLELARALGLEVMLIPKHFVPVISSLIKSKDKPNEIPAYTLDNLDNDNLTNKDDNYDN